MDNEEEEYVEPGFYRLFSGAGAVVIGLFLLLLFSLGSRYYFANTNISIIDKEIVQLVIVFFVTFVETYIISSIRNRDKDLAKFSKSEFDSAQGCGFLIFVLLCTAYLNGVLLCEINGRFDFRGSSKRKVEIISEFRRGNTRGPTLIYNYYFVIRNWNDGRETHLQVPVSVFGKFDPHNIIEFETKPGLLGFEHLASEITLSK